MNKQFVELHVVFKTASGQCRMESYKWLTKKFAFFKSYVNSGRCIHNIPNAIIHCIHDISKRVPKLLVRVFIATHCFIFLGGLR